MAKIKNYFGTDINMEAIKSKQSFKTVLRTLTNNVIFVPN